MCKLHGVRLIKGIKIFESMLKKFTVPTNETARGKLSIFDSCSIITVYCGKILGSKMRVKFCT